MSPQEAQRIYLAPRLLRHQRLHYLEAPRQINHKSHLSAQVCRPPSQHPNLQLNLKVKRSQPIRKTFLTALLVPSALQKETFSAKTLQTLLKKPKHSSNHLSSLRNHSQVCQARSQLINRSFQAINHSDKQTFHQQMDSPRTYSGRVLSRATPNQYQQ